MGAFPQPSNPFLQGMMNSAYLALAIKQSHMEQQAMTMRQQEMQRRAQVDDLNTRMGLLQSGASPTQPSAAGPEVPGGANVHTPGASINGIEVGGSDQAAPRPVDSGRTVNYGGTNYYVPTVSEQFQSQLPILQAQNLLKAQGAGQIAGAEAAAKQPFQKDLENTRAANAQTLKSQEQGFTAGQNELQRKQAEKLEGMREASATKLTGIREAGANSRSAATNATSRANNAANNAGDNAAVDPVDAAQNEIEATQNNIDQLQAGLSAEDGKYVANEKGKEFPLNAGTRSQFQARIKMYQGQLAKKKGKLAQLQVLRGVPPVPSTAVATSPPRRGAQLTDPNIAQQYVTRAGGDRAQARILAQQDGWTF